MKKVLALGIALTMVLLCACGKTEVKPVEEQTVAETNIQEVLLETSKLETAASDEGILWEDMAEIEMIYPSMGPIPVALEEVEAEINKITETEINTHVNMNPMDMGGYAQQASLMISSDQQVDLMMFPFGATSFPVMQAQGQWTDITDLMKVYAQPTLDLLGGLVQGTSVQGRLYGVCTYRNAASSEFIVMRTDVLEDLGLLEKAQSITSFDEFEEILATVAASEKWSNLAPLASSGNGNLIMSTNLFDSDAAFNTSYIYDTLGSADALISARMTDGELSVGVTYEMPEYKKMYERIHDWYEKGYIYKDVATTTDMGADLVKAGTLFAYIGNGEYGAEATHSQNCGMPMTCVEVQRFEISTSQCQTFGWGVPSVSKYPEAAVAFINMMFTDERIANLLSWGREGVDYQMVDGIACYPEGMSGADYHTNDLFYGNQFIVYPWLGATADFREKSLEAMKTAQYSPFMGFVCDTSSVTNEIAAVTNCMSEFKKIVNTGVATEDQYNEFIDKLHAVGVDKILECYESQLTQWLADNQ